MRPLLSWMLIIVILCSIAWMANASFTRLQKKKERTNNLAILPKLKLFTKDSLAFDVWSLPEVPIVMIYFNSGCEHCQYEASSIKASIEQFNSAHLIFFSSEPITLIQQFSDHYGLNEYSNIHFTKINATDVAATLGTLAIPHVFIYGADRKLVKEFRGETKPEAILKYLK